jgi:hypothetical protein
MRIFLGSSTEAQRYVDFAKIFVDRYGIEPVPWTDPDLWPGGSYLLENLFRIVETTDGAILFMHPDDRTWYRDREVAKARDNMVFEAGLFLAAHGRKRVAIVAPIRQAATGERLKAELPSDLAGLTYTGFVVRDDQEVYQTELPRFLERIARTLQEPRGQSSEFGLTFQDDQLKPLLALKRVTIAHLVAAPWTAIADPGIGELLRRPNVKEIDVLVAYRVNQVIREMRAFRMNEAASMTVCLADMFDEELNAAYLRKYGDPKRGSDYLKNELLTSIREIILGEENAQEYDKIRMEDGKLVIGDLRSRPRARLKVYLTRQRITFSYYRSDDVAWVIPLDIKKSKDPAPFAYALARSRVTELFEYYSTAEFQKVVEEARPVYSSK